MATATLSPRKTTAPSHPCSGGNNKLGLDWGLYAVTDVGTGFVGQICKGLYIEN